MGTRAGLSTILGLAAVLCAGLCLSACSMAGMSFKPLPGNRPQMVAKMQVPAETPRAAAEEEEEGFALLSFAPRPTTTARGPSDINGLISKYAAVYDVPESLIHRVVKRESTYNPRARNGPYWGLMQISHATAKSMGYRGDPSGLLDADTNLKYAVKYLRGAYIVGGRREDAAVRHYSRGYYYDAKRQGLLKEVGLR
jgi:soluble lytic murein transglycosylase-like protein